VKVRYAVCGIGALGIFIGVWLFLSGLYLVAGKTDAVNLTLIGVASVVGGSMLVGVGMIAFTFSIKFLR